LKWRGPLPSERHSLSAPSLIPRYFAACFGVSMFGSSITVSYLQSPPKNHTICLCLP
jgi:hypothetical protein